jgi:hypothetical protein
MRLASLIAGLLVSVSAVAAPGPLDGGRAAVTSSILPENDLWKEDCQTCLTGTDMTKELFEEIMDAAVDTFQAEASRRNETIVINRLWDDATVNANVHRTEYSGGHVVINMYGGLARRPEINPSALALVVCHELGHAYAGLPFVDAKTELSAEGMADYFATRNCYSRIYMKVPGIRRMPLEQTKYTRSHCYFNNDICQSGLAGALSLATLLSNVMRSEIPPAFETPDFYVTPETLLSYPGTAQCRLDTYVAGLYYDKKPACWFKD